MMNLPKQSSPIIRSMGTMEALSKGSGVNPSQTTSEDREACISRCSNASNSTSRQICRMLCRDL